MKTIKGMRKDGSIKGIKGMFEIFSAAAMNPKKYVKKQLPASITINLDPSDMEILCLISARIGAPRSVVGNHILKMGLVEAAIGCGFTFDDQGNIPEDQKSNWDTTSRSMGVSFSQDSEEEKI